MTEFEHTVQVATLWYKGKLDWSNLKSLLKQYSDDGWELVTVVQRSSMTSADQLTEHFLYFKRPKKDLDKT